MFQIARRLIKNEGGVAAIEFALVFPLFMLIVMGIMEFSLIIYQRSAIENATHEVLRVSQTRNSGLLNSQLRRLITTKIQASMITGIDRNNLQIVSRQHASLNSGETASINCKNYAVWSCFGQGIAGSVIEITVTYNYDFISPLAILANGMESSMIITSTGFVKNEYDL